MPTRGLNQVNLIGNVGQDPDIRYLQTGKAVATFSLATTETWSKDGETQSHTEWHRIEMWGGMAETVAKYVTKGSQLFISGRIRTEEWTDREGVNRKTVKIQGDRMVMLGGRGSGNSEQQPDKRGAKQDDVPF